PHATSKITSEQDLFNIQTLGFRGEALASISAVSKMVMSSAEIDKEGLTITAEGGTLINSTPCSIRGTVVEVKDLFYNTPARLKFLKTDFTENHHIIDTVINTALCNEDIAFYLNIDKNETLQLPSVPTVIQRITQIFGKDLAEGLIITSASVNDYEVKIFYSKDNFYHNRKYQYIFVNNRPIKDISLSRAIYNSLGEMISKDLHPSFFLFIKLTPSLVDFNVHPTKREVRFRDKSALFELINKAMTGRDYKVIETKGLSKNNCYTYDNEKNMSHSFQVTTVQEQGIDYKSNETFAIDHIHIGDTIIALSYEKGLLILDYHAAHERINYERLLNSNIKKIPLLFPCSVELDANSYLTIKGNMVLLSELGIEVEDFGNNSIIVRTMPDFAVHSDIDTLIKDLSEVLMKKEESINNSINPLEFSKKRLAASIACHRSLRGKGESPDKFSIFHLLKDLNKTENPDYCPHGRPTKIFFSRNELLKRFKKI
ncbi:MAG: DNA mismatch repair endonuclease MutL, partial [Thermodesulfovibrionales bacterium]|nr:DNA mismatch repair endonuclease MutL [Thermodesulfovibrionales bacterium]